MDYNLQFMTKVARKFYGEDRRLPAVVFDCDLQSSAYCSICLNDICGGDQYWKLPECAHCFHAQCIDSWLKSHSTCPLCRNQVPQLISLNENRYDLGALISNVCLLFHNFVERMRNPLNDEFTSMLCTASVM